MDILLAVDAMSHAARGNVRTVILIAGDQDFTPLVEALVNMGLFVHVHGDPKHTSSTLVHAADVFKPIQFYDYHYWCGETARQRVPVPSRYMGPMFPGVSVKQPCTVGGIPALYFVHQNNHCFAIETGEAKQNGPTNALIVQHQDNSLLKLYCGLQFGEVIF